MTRPARAGESPVPPALDRAAAWTWRLLVLAAGLLVVLVVLKRLEKVVLPLLAAVLLTALLQPVHRGLRRSGLPRALSAVLAVLLALAVLGGVLTYVVSRAGAQYPQLVDQISHLVDQGQRWLETGPLKLKPATHGDLGSQLVEYLRSRQDQVASGVLTAGRTAADVLASIVLALFLTVFMLYDGPRIWRWLTGLVPTTSRSRADHVGDRMWATVSGYVTGTFLVAVFHGLAMGITLLVVGVPLVAPLSVLVFLGSFIPLIGAVLFGGLAVLVTLVTKSVTVALIVLVVLVVENQVEGHVLQPFVVGRHVHLHPMAIALVLAAGAVLAGLPGAIFGVPLVASLNAAAKALRDPVPDDPLPSAEEVEAVA
jgi:predicted PurR-regulated permease PerM